MVDRLFECPANGLVAHAGSDISVAWNAGCRHSRAAVRDSGPPFWAWCAVAEAAVGVWCVLCMSVPRSRHHDQADKAQGLGQIWVSTFARAQLFVDLGAVDAM